MKRLLPKSVKNPSGFTLVELLVVVSIIAILSVIGLAVFTGVQKNARDAKRRGDVDAINKALEAAYNNNTAQYPAVIAAMFTGGTIPTDPLGGNYTGIPGGAVTTYNVCADLESDGRGAADTGGGTNDYCRTQQQ